MDQRAVLSRIITDIADEIMAEEGYRKPEQINNGMCAELAQRVRRVFPKATIFRGTGHWFLRYRGKFYDAEAPDGVLGHHQLPFYRREPGLAMKNPWPVKN